MALYEFVLKHPWFVMFNPTDKGIGIHPIIKPLLTYMCERHSFAAAHSAQR